MNQKSSLKWNYFVATTRQNPKWNWSKTNSLNFLSFIKRRSWQHGSKTFWMNIRLDWDLSKSFYKTPMMQRPRNLQVFIIQAHRHFSTFSQKIYLPFIVCQSYSIGEDTQPMDALRKSLAKTIRVLHCCFSTIQLLVTMILSISRHWANPK